MVELFLIAALGLAHVLLSGWVNLARGGAHGWLRPPSWFPSRQLTGPFFFAPMLFFVDWSGTLATAYSLAVLYVVPSVLTIAIQGLGHGSYMDAGTYGQRDNEFLRHVLNLIPGLQEEGVIDPVTGKQKKKNWKGQDVIVDNPIRDFAGGLLKGLLMTAPVAAIWGWWFASFAPVIFLLSGVFYPVAWFVNNRWTDIHARKLFGTPVYWAEIFQGLAFAIATLAVVALI